MKVVRIQLYNKIYEYNLIKDYILISKKYQNIEVKDKLPESLPQPQKKISQELLDLEKKLNSNITIPLTQLSKNIAKAYNMTEQKSNKLIKIISQKLKIKIQNNEIIFSNYKQLTLFLSIIKKLLK